MTPTFKPIADSAVLVEFENRIAESVNDQVLALLHAIKSAGIRGIIEAVPAYRSLLVYYDPLKLEYSKLIARLKDLAAHDSQPELESTTWEIPVWYGGPTALDLSRVAQHHGLTEQEVIDIHSSTSYRVYLVGFAPGWTFLGGLDERLHTPRLDSPRAEVPAGSISIAGQQGLICGPAMPSGWNLIGQTPERTWAPEQDEPFFIKPGDYVKIRRIDEAEFRELESRVKAGVRVSVPSPGTKDWVPDSVSALQPPFRDDDKESHPKNAAPPSRHPGNAEAPSRHPGNCSAGGTEGTVWPKAKNARRHWLAITTLRVFHGVASSLRCPSEAVARAIVRDPARV